MVIGISEIVGIVCSHINWKSNCDYNKYTPL